MRTAERREYHAYFDPEDTPEPIMIKWGGSERRRRLQPRSVTVHWDRNIGGEWTLWHVWVHGDYVHKQSSTSISATYIDYGGKELRPLEPWLADIVAASRPQEVTA